MNPLAALSIDQNCLVGENLRLPGGIFYPGILPLSVQKPQEPGTAVRLGYDLLYKPDVPLLEGQKTANGCAELYKSPPPGLQKPLLIPASEGDGLGLNSHIVPVDKQSELGLNGIGNFVRVPWISPYGDASMYPFLDMAYKASFLSQSSPFIQQQLVYQSLCATGSPAAGNERLLFVPPYNLANIASSLGPQIRMSTANPAPAVLSPLPCNQNKALQGLGPRLHQEPSAFSSSTQIHQEPQALNHTERHAGSRGEKTCQTGSTKNTLISGAHVNSTSVSQPACSVPPLQSLSSVPVDLQKPLYKSTTSASHPFYMNSQHSSSMHSSSNKTKDANSNSRNLEASSNMLPDSTLPQKATKNPREKTDSAKKFKEYSSKVEALTKLGYLPSSDCKLLLNQDQHLKEGQSPSFNLSTKTSNTDTICTSPSTGVTLGPITSDYNICSQTASRSKVDGTHHQQNPQGSPRSATDQSTNSSSHTSRGQHSAKLPKSKADRPRILPAEFEKGNSKEVASSGKLGITLSKPRAPERQSSSPESQTENTSRQIYGDSYVPPGLGYSSHYIPYSVAQTMSAQQMLIPSKGPLCPHPLLLGRNSFYPSHITPKHGLLYAGHPYQSSDKMVLPSVSASANLKSKEQLEGRSKNQEPFRSQGKPDVNHSHSDRDKSIKQTLNASDKNLPVVRDDIICIDLVRDEEDKDFSNSLSSTSEASQGISGDDHNQNKGPLPLKPLWLSQSTEQTLSLLPQSTNYNPTSHSLTSQEVSEDPLSPFPNIPEEQTMQCARTSPWYFTRNNRTRTSGDLTCGGNGGTDEIKTNASDNELNKSHQSPSKNGNSLVPVGQKSSSSDVNNNIGLKYTVMSPKSSFYEASPHTENPVCSTMSVACKDFSPQILSCRSFNSKVPVGGDMNSRPPLLCPNIEPRDSACTSPNTNADAPCCKCINSRTSSCEPRFFNCSTCGNGNLEGPCSTNNSLQITNGGDSNTVWTDANLRGTAFGKGNFSNPTSESTLSKSHVSSANRNLGVHTNENSFTLGRTCQNLSPTNEVVNKVHGNAIPEVNSDDETILANTSCGKEQTDSSIQDDPHEEPGCSKNQQSGQKKSITNLSSYVGDSFKYGTSEICTDVSELGQDQRALQVRFFFIIV